MTDSMVAIWVLNAIMAMLFSAMLLAHYNSERQPVTVRLYVQGQMKPRTRVGRIIRVIDVDEGGESATWENGDRIVFPFGRQLGGHRLYLRDVGRVR